MFGIYNWFDSNALMHAEKIALVTDQGRVTYKELRSDINRLAFGLKKMGVSKGSRVGVLYENGQQFVEIFYALLKLGCFQVLFNYRWHSSEINEMINLAQCEFLFYSENLSDKVEEIKSKHPSGIDFIPEKKVDAESKLSYECLKNNSEFDWNYFVDLEPEDEVLAIFTGGTTGKSKAAVHTQQGLLLQVLPRIINYQNDDVFLNSAPMFHIGGLSTMISMFSAGGTLVLTGGFDAEKIMKTIVDEKVTQMFLIPPNLCDCFVDSPDRNKYDLSSVRIVRLGGSTSSTENVMKVFEVFPNALACNSYSNSEFCIAINMTFSPELIRQKPHLVNSLGKEAFFSQVKLLNDEGEIVKQGEPGEAWGKSWGMIGRYIGHEREFFVEGWLPTGDILKQDSEGYYYFLDRKKDMIISGGENIYAWELEAIINGHPAVKKSAVIGMPDEYYGEIIVAVIEKKEDVLVDEEGIINYCQTRIASYKKPKRVYFIDEIPLTTIGKPQKKKLKDKIIEMEKNS